MIKERLKEAIETTLASACRQGLLGPLQESDTPVVLERPRNLKHGDYACGVALKLAAKAKMPPLKIAEVLAGVFDSQTSDFALAEAAAPGYLNFRLQKQALQNVLKQIHALGRDYGRSRSGAGKKVLLEYVSANPTGKLHIGHGRGAVYGSCLANLMRFCAYEVEEEFYVNDAGAQISQLGHCCWAIYQGLNGRKLDYPADSYPEESLRTFVEPVIAKHKQEFIDLDYAEGARVLGQLVKAIIQEEQKTLLEKLQIHFNRFFSETSLDKQGRIETVLESFRNSAFTYEKDGALWLKSRDMGDERDRVLVKSDGEKTYLTADAAYHLDKYERGYDLMINIWGADHHGQTPGLKAALQALRQDPEKLEVILTQIVNLSRDGQMLRMSKRMGNVVYLADLIDEVGVDAVRYYLAESNPQNSINFDLELAKKSGRENPAFYIQYAHARCAAILRRAQEPILDADPASERAPALSQEKWQEWLQQYKQSAAVFSFAFDDKIEVYSDQKKLIMQLSLFAEEVEESLSARQPGRLARYAYELANDLQKFYEVCRVISDDEQVTCARLGIICATKQVLANVLAIIGVSAPERM